MKATMPTANERNERFEGTLVFAAIERGSTWAHPLGSAFANAVLQRHRETPRQFARRVARVLSQIEHPSAPACPLVVLAIAHGTPAERLEARCSISTAFLRHFADATMALVLACNRNASRDERAHALALAQGLREGQRAGSVVVSFNH